MCVFVFIHVYSKRVKYMTCLNIHDKWRCEMWSVWELSFGMGGGGGPKAPERGGGGGGAF